MNRLIEKEEGTYQGVQAHDSKQFPACGLCHKFLKSPSWKTEKMDGTEII